MFTSELATLAPPTPATAELLGDQARTELFFGVFAGIVPVAEFFGALPASTVA